jgi:hypothetical protein
VKKFEMIVISLFRQKFVVGYVLLLAFIGPARGAENVIANARLVFEGLGPLRIGMTVKAIEAAGFRVKIDEGFDVNQCALADVVGYKNIQLMFEDGKVSRVEVYDHTHATLGGVRVGDSVAHVKKIHGRRLVIEQHKYDDEGHYLIVFSLDKKRALVMETDGKVVTQLRTGLSSSAQYVEGCL